MTSKTWPKPAASSDTPIRDLKSLKHTQASDFFEPKSSGNLHHDQEIDTAEGTTNSKRDENQITRSTTLERQQENAQKDQNEELTNDDPQWNIVNRRRQKSKSPIQATITKDEKLAAIKNKRLEGNRNGPSTGSNTKTTRRKGRSKSIPKKKPTMEEEFEMDGINTQNNQRNKKDFKQKDQKAADEEVETEDRSSTKNQNETEKLKQALNIQTTIIRPTAKVSAANNPNYQPPMLSKKGPNLSELKKHDNPRNQAK